MKDLDFDELDRAVNTLMGGVPKTDKSDPDEMKTVSITPTLPPEVAPASAPTPSLAPSPSTDAPVAPPSAPASAPLAARRGGRFMDVVHSSSDMKKDKPASGPVSRQGTTIEPTKSAAIADVSKPTPVLSVTPESTATTSEASVPTPTVTSDSSTTSQSDWPDPLEMTSFNKTESAEPVKEETSKTPEPAPLLEEGSETPVTAPESDDLQPLSSPFLTDAKVEKRPLGGASTATTEEAPEPDHTPVVASSETEGTVDDPQDQLPPSAPEQKKELPPEYQGDLVAIESGSTETPAPAQEEAGEKKPEASKTETHPAALLEAKTEDEPAATGPTSIAQQYKEEPSTGDQNNGAIYDTEAYHKPLAHPAKKKSGWLVVIWILVILLVGAGAGAALYFLGIF